jgi:hypothetical protein
VSGSPILFLDIDDVVCVNETYGGYDVVEALRGRHEEPAAVFREVFNPRACDVLRQVHDAMGGRLRYVVSSTWREALDLTQLARVFNEGGLDEPPRLSRRLVGLSHADMADSGTCE